MTEGRQPFTAEIKTLAKGPSTYDPLENNIDLAASPQRLGERACAQPSKDAPESPGKRRIAGQNGETFSLFHDPSSL
jgi:hypothetical protein